MDRVQYNACIGDAMRGKKLTREQRKAAFCIASKLCSGKAGSEEEARHICSLPKPPKEPEVKRTESINSLPRKQKNPRNFMIMCKNQGIDRAQRVLDNLEAHGMTITGEFRNMVINAEVECECH